MKRRVVVLKRAKADVRYIAHWIGQRSPQGAKAWLTAFDRLRDRLAMHSDLFGLAPEEASLSEQVKQAFFHTRRGRTYRAVFIITGNQVRILRVRGPGQPLLSEDELW